LPLPGAQAILITHASLHPPLVSRWATRPGHLGGPFGVSSSAGDLSASGLGGVARPSPWGLGRLSEPLQRRCKSIAPFGWGQHPALGLRCPLVAPLEQMTTIRTMLPGIGFHPFAPQHHSQQQKDAVLRLRFDDSDGRPSLGIGSPRPARLLGSRRPSVLSGDSAIGRP
jgi:hypothetical protein